MYDKRELPNASYPIRIEGCIAPDDGNPVAEALRDNETVKGVAVVKWQDADVGNVFDVYAQNGQMVEFDLLHDKQAKWSGSG